MSKELLEKLYFVSFNVIACLVFVLFSLVVHGSVKTKERNTYWIVHSYEVSHEVRMVTIKILQSELLLRNYFLTENKGIKEQIIKLDESIGLHLGKIRNLTKNNPQQTTQVDEIQKQYRIFIEAYDKLVRLYDQNKISRHLVESMQQRHTAEDQLEKLLDKFYMDEQVLLDKRIERERFSDIHYRNTILFGAMLSVVLLVVVNALIYTTLTHQRRKITTLLESADFLKALIENMNDGVYDYNIITREVHYSPSFFRQLGYSGTNLPLTAEDGFKQLIHPEDQDIMMQAIQDCLTGSKELYQITLRLKHNDGSWRWMLSRGFMFTETDKGTKRLIGMNTDITEQTNQQLALREINEELENFTYIASHDMRSPLVNLKGFATETDGILETVSDYLDNAKPQTEEREKLKQLVVSDGKEAIQFIHGAIERLQFQTEAILKLSRIGRHNYQPQAINLSEIIADVLTGLQFEIREKNIQMNVDDLPIVVSDPTTAQQILGNLIDNAVKYLDKERNGVIHIRGERYQNETVISIEDNGRGIDKKDQKKVFDIFRRARNSGNIRGSGMGLAYVRAAMRKLGGRIWFQSKLNEGTTFYLAFPNRDEEINNATA